MHNDFGYNHNSHVRVCPWTFSFAANDIAEFIPDEDRVTK